ncbi:hypothetical protein [Ilumatobacter sp.]|uniref:hypothetical protein n=1 Tax=Ilumatobacter sp. TaxID=1967498 RepID=UPI003B52F7FC
MADRTRPIGETRPLRDRREDTSFGEVLEYVKLYAKQETVGPLRGAGRWIAFGAAAAVAMGLGLMMILLGLLRLVQTELDRLARGSLSWAPYAIVLVITVALLAVTLTRIKKSTLNNEPN